MREAIFEILGMDWGIVEVAKMVPVLFTGSRRRTRTSLSSQLDRVKRSKSRWCRNFRGQQVKKERTKNSARSAAGIPWFTRAGSFARLRRFIKKMLEGSRRSPGQTVEFGVWTR